MTAVGSSVNAFNAQNAHEAQRLMRRKMFNAFMTALLSMLTVSALAVLLIIIINIFQNGAGAINLDFFFKSHSTLEGGGIFHAIMGTIIVTGIASLVSVPLGIVIAIYLSEYKEGWLQGVVRFINDLLLQMPSIVVGIFIWATLVQRIGFSGWAGSVALMLIMTPIIVRSVTEVLNLVPNLIREAGWALGVPRWRVVIGVVIPTVRPGIVTGVLLAISRAAGETAPVLLAMLGNNFLEYSPQNQMATIPLMIYNYTTQPSPMLVERAWGAALVLIFIIAFFNAALRTFFGRNKYAN